MCHQCNHRKVDEKDLRHVIGVGLGALAEVRRLLDAFWRNQHTATSVQQLGGQSRCVRVSLHSGKCQVMHHGFLKRRGRGFGKKSNLSTRCSQLYRFTIKGAPDLLLKPFFWDRWPLPVKVRFMSWPVLLRECCFGTSLAWQKRRHETRISCAHSCFCAAGCSKRGGLPCRICVGSSNGMKYLFCGFSPAASWCLVLQYLVLLHTPNAQHIPKCGINLHSLTTCTLHKLLPCMLAFDTILVCSKHSDLLKLFKLLIQFFGGVCLSVLYYWYTCNHWRP